MSGFSNSLCHFHGIHAIRIQYSNSSIQQLHKSLIVSSLDLSVSEYHSIRPYLQFCNNLWWTDCRKSLHNLSTYLRRYPSNSNLQWTQI